MNRCLLALLSALLTCSIAKSLVAVEKGGLRFSEADQVVRVHANTEPVEFSFPFRNASKQSIVITNVRSSCDCTRITHYDTLVDAGATGHIRILMDPPSTPSLRRRAIYIAASVSDSDESVDYTIHAAVRFVSPLTFSTEALHLRTGDDARPGTLSIQSEPAFPINSIRSELTPAVATISVVVDGTSALVSVAPNTNTPESFYLPLLIELSSGMIRQTILVRTHPSSDSASPFSR